jgi:S-DNA-T family DNA segregation ATPase FtsK/SpoIIIE
VAKKKSGSSRRMIEIFGFMLCALGVFLTLSFLPPGTVQLGAGGSSPGSVTGPVGELFTSALQRAFGSAAPLSGIILLLVGWNRLRGATPWRMLRAVMLISVLSLSAIAASALFARVRPGAVGRSGGLVGEWLAGLLQSSFGIAGSFVVLSFVSSLVLVWTTGFSLGRAAAFLSRAGEMAGRIPAFLLAGSMGLAERIAAWRRARRKRLAQMRITKRIEGALAAKQAKPREKERAPAAPAENREIPVPVRESTAAELKPHGGARPAVMEREKPGGYVLPGLDLLSEGQAAATSRTDAELTDLGSVLVSKLADFNIGGEILNVTVGPVVSTFEFRPASGIKISQIAGLADDIALAMEVSGIRIVAPLPGKGAVGIEVPNKEQEIVRMRGILSSSEYLSTKATIPIALGKDSFGDPVVCDLVRMPHLLIAGSTGSGKSQCIHTIVMSILMRFSPDEVRLLMIDPKVLELVSYNGIPHLLSTVVTEPKGAVRALRWLISEMEERYRLLASIGVRNIGDYNRKVGTKVDADLEGLPSGDTIGEITRLPYIVVIIDELADLILTLQAEIEEPLARLAQMARGVGIHLVLATQRPSVDVLTGVIKANFPSRISFRVATRVDSRTILDGNGAEKLLGAGDMLFLPAGRTTPRRVHGSYLTDDEIGKVNQFVKGNLAEKTKDVDLFPVLESEDEAADAQEGQDELFWDAVKLVLRSGHGSTSLLQRKLKIGYSRAARIVDQLEDAGVLGPQVVGGKARDVLIDETYLEGAPAGER